MGLSIARETREVPLFKPEDRRELTRLAEAVETAAVDAGPSRIADADPVKEAAKAFDVFKAKALKRATVVVITALRKGDWRALLADHPPRKDVLDEEGNVVESFSGDAMGFNVDTIAQPLVLASINADQFDSTTEAEAFVDDLSDPDFSRVFSEAVRLNTEAGPDPKFSASSWLDRASAVMSRSDSPSD